MDFIIYLALIVTSIILFLLADWKGNPFLYIGIMLLCINGLLLTIDSPVTYTEGEKVLSATSETLVTYPLNTIYNLGLMLYFAMGIIGSVIMWSLGDPSI